MFIFFNLLLIVHIILYILYITDASYSDCILIQRGSPHALCLSAYDGRSDSDSLRT